MATFCSNENSQIKNDAFFHFLNFLLKLIPSDDYGIKEFYFTFLDTCWFDQRQI